MNLIWDCSGVGSGGLVRVVNQLIKSWPVGEDQIRILGLTSSTSSKHPSGIETDNPLRDNPSPPRRIGHLAHSVIRTRQHLRTADFVFYPSPTPAACIPTSTPSAVMIHDLRHRVWPAFDGTAIRTYRNFTYARAIASASLVIAVSERTRHDLLAHYPNCSRKVVVWQEGADVAAGPQASFMLPPKTYVVVPGHARHKGVEIALRALPLVQEDLNFVVLSTSSLTSEWSHIIPDGYQGRVTFLEHLNDTQYVALVRSARALAMPSHFEGYGLPVAEAIAMGVPTVISPDPALLEAGSGRASQMHAWTPQAFASSLQDAIGVNYPIGVRNEDPRTWKQASAALRSIFSECRRKSTETRVPEEDALQTGNSS